MVNIELLNTTIIEHGITIDDLSRLSGIPLNKLQSRINRESEFTASDIVNLSKALALNKTERDNIFLSD